MALNPSVIVIRKQGQVVDHDFLDNLAKEYPGYIGISLVADDTLNGMTDGVSVQDIKDTMESDIPLYMIFCKNSVDDTYRQPSMIINTDTQEVICAAFLEGDLIEKDPTSPRGVEFDTLHGYLVEKIVEVLADCDNDIDKAIAKLNRVTTHRDILANICPSANGRCELLLHFPNGQTVEITKGSGRRTFEWGSASQYGEDNKGSKPIASVKASGLLSRVAAKAASSTSATPIPPSSNADKPTVHLPGNEDLPLILPSKGRTTSAENLGKWYDTWSNIGRPTGWEANVNAWDRCIPVPCRQARMEDTSKTGFKKSRDNNQLIVYDPDKHPRAKVTPSTTPAPTGDTPPAGGTAGSEFSVLVTPTAERKGIIEVYNKIKTLDDNSNLRLPPDRVQDALSSRFPTPIEEVNLKSLDDLEGISEDGFFLLVQKSPRWGARLITNLVLDRMVQKKPGLRGADAKGKIAI